MPEPVEPKHTRAADAPVAFGRAIGADFAGGATAFEPRFAIATVIPFEPIPVEPGIFVSRAGRRAFYAGEYAGEYAGKPCARSPVTRFRRCARH